MFPAPPFVLADNGAGLGPWLMRVWELILVSWFSWAGGETFRVFSAVVMAAVGLLGQLSSGFSVIRSAGAATRN